SSCQASSFNWTYQSMRLYTTDSSSSSSTSKASTTSTTSTTKRRYSAASSNSNNSNSNNTNHSHHGQHHHTQQTAGASQQVTHPALVKLSEMPQRINYQISRENNNPVGINRQEGSRTRFTWKGLPRTVLIVKKHKDKRTAMWLHTIALWLKEKYNLRVLVEPNVLATVESSHIESYSDEERHMLGKVVDFVITLGGDGTLLHVSSLFREDVPPIISFHLGTLGFLMPFNVEDYQDAISNVIKGEFLCTNRMRLTCDIYQKQQLGTDQPSKSFQVMNEVTIHRGSNPHSVVINCTINGHMLTDIVGDGLIVATATGSTAYSLSCGGPMVHPCINCILITPIAPSSLTSKPSLLPDDSVLKLN
ncbi:hypothetical protein SAMD00019534_096310, partial [Acytostelium subglobosum LB1]|uniref:hypothetical protein n=1 Tax=Acytostelium subglobosum LB1 TaxID=1410327 RepID=UPI000644F3A0